MDLGMIVVSDLKHELRKKMVRYYVWNVTLYGSET
jgi:hypothetical protein